MKFSNRNYTLILCAIPFISLLFHWHIFNLDLIGIHVWRQTQTQCVINNFYQDNMNILFPKINGHADTDRVLRLEFPIMQWLFACAYKLFGPHIVISRVLTFLLGLSSVYGMFYFCNNIFRDKGIAAICAWCFNFSPVFYYYTLNPMPDNMALACGIWSVGLFYSYINTGKIKYVVWSGIFLCIATLAKLPFALYGSFMAGYLFVQVKHKTISAKHFWQLIFIYLLLIAPAAVWYSFVMPEWQPNVVLTGLFTPGLKIRDLLYTLWGNLVSVFPELIINYGAVFFFIISFYFIIKRKTFANKFFPVFLIWGISLILYFLFEMNAIGFVHDYYLLPLLPPVFLLVAYGAYTLLQMQHKAIRTFLFVCLAILPLTAFIRADSRWDVNSPGFNSVFSKYKNELRSLTPPNAYCIIGNDGSGIILLYYIDRKGWTFDNNSLDEKQLLYYISKGASYLFVDSHLDVRPEILSHLDKKVFDKESLHVYKLK